MIVIKNIMALIGRSMSRGPGIANALRLLYHQGGNAMQFVLGSLDQYSFIPIHHEDIRKVNKMRQKYGFYVVIHGKYLYNFCRPSHSVSSQQSLLVRELEEAALINCDVVIHQGNNIKSLKQSEEVAHQNYAENLSLVLDRATGHNKILLENSSRQGTECGYTLDQLYDIYIRIPEKYRDRIGFCLDLCHVFVAGSLDVRCAENVRAFLVKFEKLFGVEKLQLVHFNDSAVPFNGANDNHASILEGYIGSAELGGCKDGFIMIVQYCKNHNIPMILETPTANISQEITLLKSWF